MFKYRDARESGWKRSTRQFDCRSRGSTHNSNNNARRCGGKYDFDSSFGRC